MVRTIFEKYAAGDSIAAIRLQLIASTVAPRRGGTWNDGSIAALLKNTHYVGYYSFTDKSTNETVEVNCPQIVPSALWSLVVERQKVSAERNSQRNRTVRFYLLRDLMYCGHCGRPIAARTKESKNEYFYYCPNRERQWRTDSGNPTKFSKRANCGFAQSMNIQKADQLVWETVLSLHADSTIIREEVKQRLVGDIISPTGGYAVARQKAENTIKRLERDLHIAIEAIDSLQIDHRLGRIEDDAFDRQFNRLRDYRLSLEGQLDFEQNGLVNREAEKRWVDWVQAFGDDLERNRNGSPEEKKQYLQGMIQRIDVKFLNETREHELTLHFSRPIVGDGLDKTQSPYVPVPGKTVSAIKLKARKIGKQLTPVGKNSITVE